MQVFEAVYVRYYFIRRWEIGFLEMCELFSADKRSR